MKVTSMVKGIRADAEVRLPRVTSVEIRAAFEFLDTVDLKATFSRRACVMKTTPHFLRGPFCNALRLAMEEAVRDGEVHQNRGWKLFLLLPRLLLHRPPRGGKVHRSKLVERFDDFARGSWRKLLEESVKCDADAATAHTRKRRRHQVGDIQRRAGRALALVQLGELSAGRQALEGAELAPGSEETLRELRNPLKRPPRARAPLPQILDHVPARPFELEEDRFAQVLRSRRGAAAGPSGMTSEHLRPVLDSVADSHLLFLMGE